MDIETHTNDGPNDGRSTSPNLYSPSMPAEVLGLIFEHLHPDEGPGDKPQVEVALSHVSTFWRAVALASPHLWAHITIRSNRSLKRASIYLSRSGQHRPLVLNINIDKYDKLITTKSPRKSMLMRSTLASFLSKHIHRIQRFSFLCYHQETLDFVLKAIINATAPILQQLRLKYIFTSNPQPWTQGTRFLEGGAPLLRIMDTDMINSLSNLKCLENLTTLYLHELDKIGHQTFPAFANMLRSPQRLLYLSLQGRIHLASWPLHIQGPQLSLANLKGLRLLDDGMMAVKFLLSLNAPQLETLWLECSFDSFHHLFDSPQVTVLGPKFPALRYLTLTNSTLHISPKFSALCPTITHLHLSHADLHHPNKLQEALLAGWPSLGTLVFSMFRATIIKQFYPTLSNAFASRSANNRPIKYLLVDKDQIEEIRASGIMKQVEVDTIHPLLYHEAWWNKLDQQPNGIVEQNH